MTPSTTENSPLALSPEGGPLRIEADLPCRCGYNLRGLSLTGRCPECGAAIIAALRGGTLCGADSRWLRQIRTGLALLLVLHVFWVLPGGFLDVSRYERWVGLIFILAMMAAACAGAWLISLAEPGTAPGAFRRALGVILRCATALWFALTAFSLLHPDARQFGVITYGVHAGVLCLPLLYSRLWELADRAQVPSAAWTFRILTWLLPACALLIAPVWPVGSLLGFLFSDVLGLLVMTGRHVGTLGFVVSAFTIGRLWQATSRP